MHLLLCFIRHNIFGVKWVLLFFHGGAIIALFYQILLLVEKRSSIDSLKHTDTLTLIIFGTIYCLRFETKAWHKEAVSFGNSNMQSNKNPFCDFFYCLILAENRTALIVTQVNCSGSYCQQNSAFIHWSQCFCTLFLFKD